MVLKTGIRDANAVVTSEYIPADELGRDLLIVNMWWDRGRQEEQSNERIQVVSRYLSISFS